MMAQIHGIAGYAAKAGLRLLRRCLSCNAFAEDVVKGEAKLEECIPLMRNLNRSAQQDGGNDEAGSIGGKT